VWLGLCPRAAVIGVGMMQLDDGSHNAKNGVTVKPRYNEIFQTVQISRYNEVLVISRIYII